MKILKITAAAAVGFALSAAAASAATYDFAAGADGEIGESIWGVYNTDTHFEGPNLKVTAGALLDDDNDRSQWVYFDSGNAGMGVCKDRLVIGSENTSNPDSTDNLCNPGSDDGITTDDEILRFEATETLTKISGIWLNANHDPDFVTDATFLIGDTEYNLADFSDDPVDSIFIALDIILDIGEYFTVSPINGSPNTYISALEVSAVPVPAAGVLLLGGLGGLAAMKRRKKKAA